jgi:hypothetical protein
VLGDIVSFPNAGRIIDGKLVAQPKNRADYLATCKRLLSLPDYELLLLAIMDEEYYDMADYSIQGVVNSYKEFKV